MVGKVHNGRCLCGAVTFTVEPLSSEVGTCHCGTCRHWTSSPFMAIECSNSFKASSKEALGIFNSSDWAERGFCRECGTTLFYRVKESGNAFVSVGTIEGLKDIKLTTEVFIDEKPDYYSFSQSTTKITGEELFALFAEQDQ